MPQQNNHPLLWLEFGNHNNELTMVVITSISIVILCILWYKFTFSSSSPSLPPGPRSLPIVGYLPFLDPNLHKQFTNMALKYGPIFKFQIGTKLHIVINNMELAKMVVRDQDETIANRKLTVAATVITNGGQDIAYSNDSYQRDLRKIFVKEALSVKNLKSCSPFRRDEIRKTIENIYGKIGTAIQINDISFSTVVNIVTSMLGRPNDGTKDSHLGAEFQILASKILELLAKPNLSDFFPSLAWLDLQGIERDMKKQHKKLDQIFTKIIDDRMKSNFQKLDDEIADEEKKDFLQILLELKDKKEINLTQVKGLIMDIMIGATDTTTTLIEWVMTEMIKNPNIMKRVQDELSEVVGVNNIVEESHLPKLQYLDATIKETFRLHPVGALLMPRTPSLDCTVAGYTIPKGCTVFVNAYAIHRDPSYWDNPLEFNPERFLTYEGANKFDLRGNNINFIPFGSGRRICPGIPLAEKMQMYFLASLFHSFNWSLANGEKHDFSEKLTTGLHKLKPLIAIPTQRLPSVSLYM